MVLGTDAGPVHLRAYASALEREARESEERATKRACHRKFEYEELDSYKALTNSGRANFERFLKALDTYFELTGFRLGFMQVRRRYIFFSSLHTRSFHPLGKAHARDYRDISARHVRRRLAAEPARD